MKTIHVFSGKFDTRKDACKYSEAQWEPEPDESCSDAEYEDWEDRNPTWRLKEDLGCSLDSDFIETIYGGDILNYLDSQLEQEEDKIILRNKITDDQNTLILIMSMAYDGGTIDFCSTKTLRYHGEFNWGIK